MPSLAALRHAPWSSSKVKCAQRCPQEFHYRYTERIPEPLVSPEQRIGKAIHGVLELVLARRSLEEALEHHVLEVLRVGDHERTCTSGTDACSAGLASGSREATNTMR